MLFIALVDYLLLLQIQICLLVKGVRDSKYIMQLYSLQQTQKIQLTPCSQLQ